MKEVFQICGSVNWGRHWSLIALTQIMGYTDLEVQTCPLTVRVTNIHGGSKGVEMTGVCNGTTFKTACTLTKHADGSWSLDMVCINCSKGFFALTPERNANHFPNYPSGGSRALKN